MKDYTLLSYKKGINATLGKRNDGKLLDYDEAEKIIVDYLNKKHSEKLNANVKNKDLATTTVKKKDKEDLRKDLLCVKKDVAECILDNNMSIRGYQGDKINDFVDEMVQEHGGYSILSDAFYDDDVSDIYCIDWNLIFVEKHGHNEKYPKTFRNPEHYIHVIQRFLEIDNKEVNQGDHQIVDFELYQDRGCVTHQIVSPQAYSLTIRKHSEDHITLDQLLEWGCMNEEIAEFLGMVIDGEGNLIQAGITGSGKTTTLRALLDYFVTRNKKRMLVCEDTQELFPKNEHTLQLVTTTKEKLSDLIVTSLRLKPKYIVVGEVRGPEAKDAVEAMETGHSTLFTMHGGTPINIINRLVTKYLMAMPGLSIEVVERIIGSAIDYIVIQDDIPNIGRKITSIDEVTYDFEKRTIRLEPIFRYSFQKHDFVFLSRIDKEKADKMMRRGVPWDRIQKWIKTGDKEKDDAFVKELNEKYFREKPEREKKYKKRMQEREIEKKNKKDVNTEKSAEEIESQKISRILMNKEAQNKHEIDTIVKNIDNNGLT